MAIKKINMNGENQNVATARNNLAGVPTDPGNHYGKGRTFAEGEYVTPAQSLATRILNKWFGRGK